MSIWRSYKRKTDLYFKPNKVKLLIFSLRYCSRSKSKNLHRKYSKFKINLNEYLRGDLFWFDKWYARPSVRKMNTVRYNRKQYALHLTEYVGWRNSWDRAI